MLTVPRRAHPARRARARVLAVVAVAAVALGGCTTLPDPTVTTSGSGPDPTATTTVPAAPSSVELTDMLDRSTTLTLSDGVVRVGDGTLGRGSSTVTATFTSATATLTVPAPGSARWEVEQDGSAVLVDDSVPEVGGMTPPVARDAANATLRTDVLADGDAIEVSLLPRSATLFPVTVTFDLATSALERAVWAKNLEGGRSLQTFPTAFGRSGSQAALSAVRIALVAAEPEAASSVMDKQLRCHALGAPTKESWNLEPWRPDVGYMDYLLARCNPAP